MKSVRRLKDFSRKDLSKQLAMLLALSNGTRSSDLHVLDVKYKQFSTEGVLFRIPGPNKTRRLGPSKEVFFHRFTEEPNLCPVENLKVYKEKTSLFRKLHQGEPAPPFIFFPKPHEPVSSSSNARWLKDLLDEDTSLFNAHSTRAAATSTAKLAGLSTTETVRIADWSRESTFEIYH